MKLNFFDIKSPLYDLRWLIVSFLFALALMLYHDIPGGRIFTSKQKAWSKSGPGYHK